MVDDLTGYCAMLGNLIVPCIRSVVLSSQLRSEAIATSPNWEG
jgi:hypothetical protein